MQRQETKEEKGKNTAIVIALLFFSHYTVLYFATELALNTVVAAWQGEMSGLRARAKTAEGGMREAKQDLEITTQLLADVFAQTPGPVLTNPCARYFHHDGVVYAEAWVAVMEQRKTTPAWRLHEDMTVDYMGPTPLPEPVVTAVSNCLKVE